MIEVLRVPRTARLFIGETALLLLIGCTGMVVGVGFPESLRDPYLLPAALLFSLCVQLSLHYHGLYRRDGEVAPEGAGRILLRAVGLAGIALYGVGRILPLPGLDGASLLLASSLSTGMLAGTRALYDVAIRRGVDAIPTLLLGDGELARELLSLLSMRRDFTVVSLFAPPTSIASRSATSSPVAGEGWRPAEAGAEVTALPPPERRVGRAWEDLLPLVEEQKIRLIVVALDDFRQKTPIESLLKAKLSGVRVVDAATLYEELTGRVLLKALRPSGIIYDDLFLTRDFSRRLGRLLDLVISGLGLILAAPLMALVAIAIKLDSRGPVLYRQERLGLRGRPFFLFKFRSMRTDAEKDGPQWAREGEDPRVTRVGRFIRQTRLDELPQLWNVLIGEMSLVGPRPERPVFGDLLDAKIPFFRARLMVKPGITGYAQVRHRYAASVEDSAEKLAYDLYYVKYASLWFDLAILLDTVKVVLLRIGSR